MLPGDITVEYVPAPSVFQRRPVAHTCGRVLKIPTGESGYQSYHELRSEFLSILSSGYMEMDIV